MNWTHWALDVTPTAFPATAFVPIELDAEGNPEAVVWGMTLITDKPPGKLIAVVSQDGQQAVEEWCDANPETVAKYFPPVPLSRLSEERHP